MNLKIVKLDLTEVEYQLTRIANCLELILETTNPTKVYDTPATDKETGVFYPDEEGDIVRENLVRMGKEYRPRTPR